MKIEKQTGKQIGKQVKEQTRKQAEKQTRKQAKKQKKFRKEKFVRYLLFAVFSIISVTLLTYPFVSDYLNSRSVKSAIKTYQQKTEELDSEETDELLAEARLYNELLAKSSVSLADAFGTGGSITSGLTSGDGSTYDYNTMLAVDGSSIMAYLEVPKIRVYLPIYHGTSTEVLQRAVGHLEGSSLPVGGESTHAVLSGHTGLQTARLFTDLNDLEEGDYFFIHVLGETLAYCVDQILVTTPDDVSALQIEEGMDYVTLVTCTPYGINSHRLLVRGVRTDYEEAKVEVNNTEVTSNYSSQWMRQYVMALAAGIVILIIVILLLTLLRRIKRKRRKKQKEKSEEKKHSEDSMES